MENLPEDVKEIAAHYLSLLTPENQSIMLARLVLALQMQGEGLPI